MHSALGALVAATEIVTAQVPTRVPVASLAILPAKQVSQVQAMRVDFSPAQEMPAHMHPVPVVCFVAEGSLAVRIGEAPVRIVGKGEVTFEPAGTIVHFFRNLSTSQNAQLYCTVLIGAGDKRTSVMLGREVQPER